jgi:hypothetical protein
MRSATLVFALIGNFGFRGCSATRQFLVPLTEPSELVRHGGPALSTGSLGHGSGCGQGERRQGRRSKTANHGLFRYSHPL